MKFEEKESRHRISDLKMLTGVDYCLCFEFDYPLKLPRRECLQHSNWPLLELKTVLRGHTTHCSQSYANIIALCSYTDAQRKS